MAPMSPGDNVRTGLTFFALLLVAVLAFALFWEAPDDTDGGGAQKDATITAGNGEDAPGNHRGEDSGVVSAPYTGPPPTGLTVVGRVEDASGRPVIAAPLGITFHSGESTFGEPHSTTSVLSGAEGAFSFTLPSGGAWSATVTSRISGYVASDLVMSLRPDSMDKRALIVVHPLDGERTVRIVDPDGRPISGVRLRVAQTDQSVESDESGRAQVRTSRSFGPVWAVLTHKRGIATTRSIDTWSGEGPRDLEFVLRSGYGISGIASDPEGRPIPGVVVRLVNWTVVRTETDQQGRFSLAGLDPNREGQRLTFRHPNYLPRTVTSSRKRAGFPMEVTLQRGLDVCGTVSGPDGRPVMGALVTLGEDQVIGRSRRTTGARGEFCLGAPMRGELILRVTYPGLAPHVGPVHPGPDVPPLEIKLERGNVLGGRVLDEGGRPIAGATLSFYLDKPRDLGRWADTDQSGHWLVEGLPLGVVQLECFEYGYIPVEKNDVPTGRRDLDVVMTRSGGIKGTIVDGANQPITRFRVALTPSMHPGDLQAARPPATWGLPGRLFETPDGQFSSGRSPLRPNQAYRVEVSAGGYATRVIDPYAPTLSPRNAPMKIVLTGGGAISGRVVDAQGQGIGDAVVAPVDTFPAGVAKLDHGPRATTDDTGAYTLSGLATGPVELEARHGRFAPVRRLVRVSSQLSQEPDLVMLAAGSLRVEVRVSPEDLGQTRVVLESDDAQARVEHPLTSNVLTLHWVVAGRYRVSLASSRSELDGLGTTVDILAGRRRPIAFEPVPATCDLLGHVTVDGRVLSDTVIDLVLSRVHPDGTRTHHANRGSRPNGSFSFPDLKPGRWHIGASFTHGGQRLSGQLTVGVKPGQPPIQIRLRTQ
ncbi:MAG: hypothetical protein CMJ90_02450 [Planctomycetes bacterium]|nr:hypothetical protein [Planctomycetota bacterium]